eukprot:2254807-Karenia_brevis.AAC.1
MSKRHAQLTGEIEYRQERYHCAHVMMTSEEGTRINIRGPFRKTRRLAQQDLNTIQTTGTDAGTDVSIASNQKMVDAMTNVVQKLKSEAEQEKKVMMDMTAEPIVMGTAKPYKPSSAHDALELWQSDEEESQTGKNADHKNQLPGLDAKTRRKFEKRILSEPAFSNCKKMMHSFIGGRVSASQIRQLISILPKGWDAELGIEPEKLEEA